MIDITGLYILNSKRELIYLQENIIPKSKELDPDYLSNFFSTLQTIAQKIGEEEVKIIDLGNSKFFLTKDRMTNIEFILKCGKDIKQKKVFETHKRIVNLFIEKFIGNFNNFCRIIEFMSYIKIFFCKYCCKIHCYNQPL